MRKFYAILAFTLLCGASSYAIDQVTLTTGELIEGKVLSDVPNRHVDIQLVNGEKRRYPKSQVVTVERDVPSNKDREMYGTGRRFFFGPQAGIAVPSTGEGGAFLWGAKIGSNSGNLGGALLAPALSFRRFSSSSGSDLLGLSSSRSLNFLDLQLLLRRIGNSGLYLGPQLGLAITTRSSTFGTDTTSENQTAFTAGGEIGYDLQFSDSFSIGPNVIFDHVFGQRSDSSFTFALTALFHFE